MIYECIYVGFTPVDNQICLKCENYLEVCNPIITTLDGYSASSECDRFMCEGCSQEHCIYKLEMNI